MIEERPQPRGELAVVLVAAVLQGWLLYALHVALRDDLQITDWTLFPALYVLAVFAPLTAQLLVQFARQRLMWLMVLALSASFFALAWHQSSLRLPALRPWSQPDDVIPAALALTLLWLHLMPFMRARLMSGSWRARYPDLFAASWRNVLVLLEAGVFTLTLWLLLYLWGRLFAMLQIDFFAELFREPVFVYPVSAIAFGLAIHLMGSVERIVSVVLEQVLSLFKWLGLVAAVILVVFTLALATKLPTLIEEGTRAIGAGWLLWLVALTVLLINAAWRDGSNIQPYPRFICTALRWTMPLLLVVALTALYSLVVRADAYGLTVERVWAFLVAALALAYALGYSLAALRGGRWLASLGSTNVQVALAFIALMLLCLTPPLSPQRLTASSQYKRVLESSGNRAAEEALRTLRFESGRYGRERLLRLQVLEDHPRAQGIRAEATHMLALTDADRHRRGAGTDPVDRAARIAALRVFPAGQALDASLQAALASTAAPIDTTRIDSCLASTRCVGLFVNVDDSPDDEFVLLAQHPTAVFRKVNGGWQRSGVNYATSEDTRWDALLEALERGEVATQAPRWQDLRIGAWTLQASP